MAYYRRVQEAITGVDLWWDLGPILRLRVKVDGGADKNEAEEYLLIIRSEERWKLKLP